MHIFLVTYQLDTGLTNTECFFVFKKYLHLFGSFRIPFSTAVIKRKIFAIVTFIQFPQINESALFLISTSHYFFHSPLPQNERNSFLCNARHTDTKLLASDSLVIQCRIQLLEFGSSRIYLSCILCNSPVRFTC